MRNQQQTKNAQEEEQSDVIQRLEDELLSERNRIEELLRLADSSHNQNLLEINDSLRLEKQVPPFFYLLMLTNHIFPITLDSTKGVLELTYLPVKHTLKP